MILRIIITISLMFIAFCAQAEIYSPKADTFILSNEIGMRGEDYSPLIRALNNASPGERINITLLFNQGGDVAAMETILKAMSSSRGEVHTWIIGYAHSAAFMILMGGKYIHLPYGPVGIDHMAYIGIDGNGNKIRPFFLVNIERQIMAYHKMFLSSSQFINLMNGEDVYTKGLGLCAVASYHAKVFLEKRGCTITSTWRN